MTPDQLRHEEARAWLDRAGRDLQAARLLIAGDANTEALFHCQQAVEKALKAFLTFHERAFRKTHDLGDLSPECFAIDDSLQVSAEAMRDDLSSQGFDAHVIEVPNVNNSIQVWQVFRDAFGAGGCKTGSASRCSSTSPRRGAADQKQVERLKELSYQEGAKELVRLYGEESGG